LGDIGEPGSFDDEQAFLVEEEEALELMDEQSRGMYLEAKAWIDANPPNRYVVCSSVFECEFVVAPYWASGGFW
jgi:hypothetical protein